MFEDESWIKVRSKIVEWEWFRKSEMVHLWIFLLAKANKKDKLWEGVEVKRGQLVTSLKSINEKTGIAEQTIRTCITRLVKSGQITTKSTNKYTIITITNYDRYQVKDEQYQQTTNKQLTNEQQTTNKQLTTTKEYKNNIYCLSLTRTREEEIADICLYWNGKIDIMTKQIPAIDMSYPARLAKTNNVLDKYGIEKVKLAIDNVARNEWLRKNKTFDFIIEPEYIEKVLGGFYDKYENKPKIQQSNGNSKSDLDRRLNVNKTTGTTECDF